jgi:hypothetical protein
VSTSRHPLLLAIAMAGLVVGAAFVAGALRGGEGSVAVDHSHEPALASSIGCRARGGPSDARWVLDDRQPLLAVDWEAAEVLVPFCDELVLRRGDLVVTVSAGGPLPTDVAARGPLLGSEAERRRVGDTEVEVLVSERGGSSVAWLVDDALLVARAAGPADDVLDIVPLVTADGQALAARPGVEVIERRQPTSWLLEGAERSSVSYDVDGEEITVETARRPIDAATVFGGDGASSQRVDLGELGTGWLLTDDTTGSAILAMSTPDALVQVKGSTTTAELRALAGRLQVADRPAWDRLVTSAREHGPGPITRDVDRNVLRDVVAFAGPLLVLAGLVWLVVRLVDRRCG